MRPLLLAALLLATYGFTRAIAPVPPAAPADLDALSMTLTPWSGVTAPAHPPAVMQTLAADRYIRRWYRRPATGDDGRVANAVEMDVAYYARPRIGARMHSPLNCLPGNGWQIARMDTATLPGAGGVRVRTLVVERGPHRVAMAYWFQNHTRVLTGEGTTRFQLLADALRRQPTDAGLVRVMAPLTATNGGEQAVLSFAERLVPALSRVF